jgi:hypothetical protein
MGRVVKSMFWRNIELTETGPAGSLHEVAIPAHKPTLEERIETMRRVRNKIVHHQCEIARLEGQLEDEQAGMLSELHELNKELRFLK